MTPDQIRSLVTEYYARIDGQDIDWVMDFFGEDASYIRADTTFRNRREIEAFYRGSRKIRGTHTLDQISVDQNLAFVTGCFNGHGENDSPRSVGFCDQWQLRDGQARFRQTWLALGSNYVRR